MAKVTLLDITIKNFMSVGNVPITLRLDNGLTTLITGKNGVGKSVLFQAIFWVLFNEGVETDILADGFINYANERDTQVVLNMLVGKNTYTITRTRKPNSLKLEKNGSPETLHSSNNFDEEIVRIFGIDAEIARNTLLLDANSIPFMKMKGPAQRSLMERLLTLLTMSVRAKDLKAMQDKNTVELKVEEKNIENLLHINAQHRLTLGNLKRKSDEWEITKNNRIATMEKDMDALLNLDIQKGIKHHETISQLQEMSSGLKSQMDEHQNTITHWTQRKAIVDRIHQDIQTFDKAAKSWEIEREKWLNNANDRIIVINEMGLPTLLEQHEAKASLTNELKTVQREISTLEFKHQAASKKLEKGLKMKADLESGICPTCKKPIHDAENLSTIEEIGAIPSLQSEIQGLESALSEALDKEGGLQEKLSATEKVLSQGPSPEKCRALLNERDTLSARSTEQRQAINPNLVMKENKEAEALKMDSPQHCASEIAVAKMQFEGVEERRRQIVNTLDGLLALKLPPKEDFLRAEAKIAMLEEQYANAQKETNPYTTQMQSVEGSIKEPDYTQLAYLKKMDEHYKILIKLLTDNKGFLRKNLVSTFTPYINKRINHYLTLFKSEHIAEINSDLTTSLTYRSRYETSYANASKGQRLRLNFATNRAFRDLLLMFGKSYNLTLIDEYFDSGGDKEFFAEAFNVMDKEENTVFIISHREDLAKMADRHLSVTMDNGYTKLNELAV